MKLRLLKEDEFDFLDTDEPVQDGEDSFDDPYDELQEQLEDFIGWLEFPPYEGTSPVKPHIAPETAKTIFSGGAHGEITYWIDDVDVSEQIRSHPLYAKDNIVKFGGANLKLVITTNLEYDGALGCVVYEPQSGRWDVVWM